MKAIQTSDVTFKFTELDISSCDNFIFECDYLSGSKADCVVSPFRSGFLSMIFCRFFENHIGTFRLYAMNTLEKYNRIIKIENNPFEKYCKNFATQRGNNWLFFNSTSLIKCFIPLKAVCLTAIIRQIFITPNDNYNDLALQI
jgi:hypothetical protein